MKLTSPAFEHEGTIPTQYTCDGENTSPALHISDVPEGTICLALIMEDPDVPKDVREDGMWDHWVVWNIPSDTTDLPETIVPPGIQGHNTRGTLGYQGPCPPDKEHRYFFKLYALDTTLDLKEGSTKQELLNVIEGHIVAEAILMGTYDRPQNQ